MKRTWWGALAVVAAVSLCMAASARADETMTATFDDAGSLEAWKVSGDVSVDTEKDREGGDGGAMKIGPGGKAVWTLRDADASGSVAFYVYEDMGVPPAKEGKDDRATGPLYGIADQSGRMIAAGSIYAPYLSGRKTYSLTTFNPNEKEKSFFKVQYLGLPRKEGWHKWEIVFDPSEGAKVLFNGKDVNGRRKRFHWHKSGVSGFSQVVFTGDQANSGQVLWVDDVTVTLGGAMQTQPEEHAPPPPPPTWPEEDPKLEGDAPQIVENLRGVHPRLLFTKDEIAKLKAFKDTEIGQICWKRMLDYVPACKPPETATFQKDATDGQRQGLWRMPTVGLHYLITGDQKSFDKCVGYMKLLLETEHWELNEIDNGMSAANVMIGAGLLYDWLYHDLDPEFREKFGAKIWEHARRMYHAGHLMGDRSGPHYWEGDPQNNHRWHRNAGFALCALAAYEGKDDQKWLIKQLYDEMAYVAKWLPEDGTSHESPTYMIFGAAHLTLGMQATDRCFGTEYLKQPFFKHVTDFMMSTITPGLDHRFTYGDQGGVNVGSMKYDCFELKAAGVHDRGDILAVLNKRLKAEGTGAHTAWMGLVWYPKDLEPTTMENAPTRAFFSDLGLAFIRDTWAEGGRAAMFKCGPFGGYTLNLFAHEQGKRYVNIAHDDPDANSFMLFTEGDFVAESDRYSKHKKSANHNTILVNGYGQANPGRPEGGVWSQPGGDMSENAVITAMASKGRNYALEGEAAGMYIANPKRGPKRPALERYRRTFVWVEGQYVLILDDIRAPSAVDIDWLIQSEAVETRNAAEQQYTLVKGKARCPFQVVASETIRGEVVDSSADHRGKPMGWKQLRLKANTQTIRLASVYDLWGKGNLTVSLMVDEGDVGKVTVNGPGIEHAWDWTPAQGEFDPSKVVGKTANGAEIITLEKPEPETRELIEQIREADAEHAAAKDNPGKQKKNAGKKNKDAAAASVATGVAVTASSFESKAHGGWGDFPPENVVDGKTEDKSSWRAEGKGEWLQLDLNRAGKIAGIDVAFVGGDKRQYRYDVKVSEDGKSWTEVYSGQSSGKTKDFETHDLKNVKARYVRIVGHGNTNEKFKDWINVTEVRVRTAG